MKKTNNNPESSPLRVLILEDNPADAELVERELKRARIIFTSRLVEGKREFSKALADFQPQIIISDFKLPRFDGLAALEMARLRAPNTPFLFVSGSIGEEKAIAMLAQGASDYILKDNLARLGPAVKRLIEATRLQREKKKIDEELRRHIDELQLLAEAADHFVQINDLDEIYEYLAQVSRDLSGADYLLLSLYDEKLEALRPKIVRGFEPFRETIRRRFHIDPMQMDFYLKDMSADHFGDFVSRQLLPERDGLYGLVNRKLPHPYCRTIEKLLAIDEMFTMGFSWENQLYGGLTLLFKKGNKLKNHAQIEALLNQAAVTIKRLLAEKSLRASEERLRDITFSMADWVWETDENGVYTYSSEKGLDLFGSTQKDIIGKTPFDFMPQDEAKRVVAIFSEIVANKAPIKELENWNIGKNGKRICLLTNGVPILDEEGNLKGYRGVDKDITERKLAEEQIRTTLQEKEVLLQEIHHRVKNNLQIISGLLTLQADQAAGKSLDEIFRASQDRIHSIALIHEKLYNSPNLAEIAFDEYLRALIENLFTSHGIAAGRITVTYEMESILFTIDKAIPLGLIVNELVTNALKHAFTDGRQGEIRIGLHGYMGAKSYALKTDSGMLHCTPTCELIVADNGVGLPAGQVPGQQKTLGMKLVSMLAQQLQAELKVKTGPGAEFRLLFSGLPIKKDVKDKNHGG